MLKTFEAIVNPDGRVQTKEPLRVNSPQKAILTLLGEEPSEIVQKKKPTFKWAGALAHLKDKYTSVELQHQISKWRTEED